jgi:hypothetical protein
VGAGGKKGGFIAVLKLMGVRGCVAGMSEGCAAGKLDFIHSFVLVLVYVRYY